MVGTRSDGTPHRLRSNRRAVFGHSVSPCRHHCLAHWSTPCSEQIRHVITALCPYRLQPIDQIPQPIASPLYICGKCRHCGTSEAAPRPRSACFHRLAPKRGSKRAIVAIGPKILVLAHYLLQHDCPFRELGGDYYQQLCAPGLSHSVICRLQRLGYHSKSPSHPLHTRCECFRESLFGWLAPPKFTWAWEPTCYGIITLANRVLSANADYNSHQTHGPIRGF